MAYRAVREAYHANGAFQGNQYGGIQGNFGVVLSALRWFDGFYQLLHCREGIVYGVVMVDIKNRAVWTF